MAIQLQCIAEVTGHRTNRGAGFGLEIPCKFHFFGPKPYTDKFEKFVAEFKDKGLL